MYMLYLHTAKICQIKPRIICFLESPSLSTCESILMVWIPIDWNMIHFRIRTNISITFIKMFLFYSWEIIQVMYVTFAELIARVRFSCFLNKDIFPFLVLLMALLSIVSGTAMLISSLKEKRDTLNSKYQSPRFHIAYASHLTHKKNIAWLTKEWSHHQPFDINHLLHHAMEEGV